MLLLYDDSQLQQMVLEERAEEKRRLAAIREVARHPLRLRRLRLRHDRERKGKQVLISWIRTDIEVGGTHIHATLQAHPGWGNRLTFLRIGQITIQITI